MIDRLLSFVAPHSCCGCGNLGAILCDICKNDIVSEAFSSCLVCLHPTIHNNLCDPCSQVTGIESAWVAASRRGSIKALLDQYKFDSAKEAGRVSAELFNLTLPVLPAEMVVTGVPTAFSHQRSRGFDHTKLIAKQFARSRDLPYSSLLTRHDIGTQHFKTRTQRLRFNSQNLEVVREVPKQILLIDDIYTTGTTISACVTKLKESGAKDIYVAILARQTLDDTDDL